MGMEAPGSGSNNGLPKTLPSVLSGSVGVSSYEKQKALDLETRMDFLFKEFRRIPGQATMNMKLDSLEIPDLERWKGELTKAIETLDNGSLSNNALVRQHRELSEYIDGLIRKKSSALN